jgi:ATP-binding cassette, subfamily C, bacterial
MRGVVRFAAEIAREMPRRAAAVVALSLAATTAEAAGVVLLARLLTLTGVGEATGAAGALASAVDRGFRTMGAEPTLGGVLFLFVVLVAGVALLQRASTLVSNRMQQEAALRARTRLYRAVTEARWIPLARLRGSDLLAALTTEAERVGAAAGYLASLLVRALLSAAYLALALRVSPGLTALALACGAVLLALLRGQRVAARRAGEEGSRATEALVAAASEHLGAVKVVKSHGAEERNAGHFASAARVAVEARLRGWRAYADAQMGFSVGSVVLLAGLAYLSLERLRVAPATVLLLVFLFYRLVPRLAQLQTLFQMLIHDLPAWERLSERARALEAEREALAGPAEPVALREAIRFEGVSFAYEPGGLDVVHALELEIPARRTTAVVGPSGAGKTTVADLVMGLVAPREGRVAVDGRALDEGWLRAWRAGIGYVAQDAVLFHETVRDNLLWARPEAGEEELWEALRLAAAEDFVRALPRRLDTVVGDRGLRLSGGERQRLALARALLRRPSLLILDEATSALDTENERRVREAVRNLRGSVTILVITHRLPSVRDADLVHVLEAGRRVESGSWEELVARPGGRFRALWEAQAGGEPA